ncbi:tldc domain-containing protein [Stylonychia lemnae]|uniref:Tldc domain-containing protein n=1 Tax=Stylonychia lemnae TaxID=5949 RepID=A0A078AU83_STYLE|nr:tldc domain-containing protein [Stylonychia lemnae]|eukprot:CDW84393.1 tldc domain-containing protein [Stylonychia lemnae]
MEKVIAFKIRDGKDRYQIIENIDQGAQGIVQKAKDNHDPRQQMVAYKYQNLLEKQNKINNQAGTKTDREIAFSRELLRIIREIASFALCHPNIVEIRDSFLTEEGEMIIISELAEMNLFSYREKQGNIAPSQVSVMMLQLLEGLDCIHKNGFIHRDLSPDNILVFSDNLIKISDFGVAAQGNQTKSVYGKVNYMAPQITLQDPYNESVDIWSLGIILYYLCTGKDKKGSKSVSSIRLSKQQIEFPQNYSQFQEIFDQMTQFDEICRPSITQLRQDFIKLINPNESGYLEYQKKLIKFQLDSIKQRLDKDIEKYFQFLQIYNDNPNESIHDAIHSQVNDLQNKLKEIQKQVRSYIAETFGEKEKHLKFQNVIETCQVIKPNKGNEQILESNMSLTQILITDLQKEVNSALNAKANANANNSIQQQNPADSSLQMIEENTQFRMEFDRLLGIYVKESQKTEQLNSEKQEQLNSEKQEQLQKEKQELLQKEKQVLRQNEQQVLQQNEQQELLYKLEGEWEQLYKGSTDGFKAQKFHQKCDNKGPTVTFILSEFGQVFGGYTSVPWKTPENYFQRQKDKKAFVFQLTKNTLHPLNISHVDHAVSHFQNQIIQFGLDDIHIEDDCNLNKTNYCSIGNTYKLSKSINLGNQTSNEYLAGAKKFRVLEIVVYCEKKEKK